MKFHPPNRKFTRLYRGFLYRWAGKAILLLTTKGRRTGREHTVGLQYELIDDRYYIGAADGECADWYRNLLHDPHAKIQVGDRSIEVIATVVSDAERIVDFLQYRLRKRPFMIRLILFMDGIKGKLAREVLLEYAKKIRMVILTPDLPGTQ